MGEATTDLNEVLKALNDRSDTIREDWRSFKNFNDTYAAAAPDIVAILNSGSTVSTTIADRAQAPGHVAAQHDRLRPVRP